MGAWNRAARGAMLRSGKERRFIIPCATNAAHDGGDVVEAVIAKAAEIAHERGITLDWISYLPAGDSFSARDVVNAIGRALADAGIENNLVREVPDV